MRQSRENDLPREMLQARVLGYAREIVPSFNAYAYFRFGYWVAKKVARLIYKVRVGLVDNDALMQVDRDSTVVFVMNHRSNMDYILVAFLAAERTSLSYAVGEWARIWPLQTLIKLMGAFFVRRNSGDPLYRLVLERYVRMATREGVCQAVFLEGGLSRDGKLRPPKYGFIDYMLRGYDPDEDRDIVFIPVGVNYDRVIEDRSLLHSIEKDAPKRSWWFVMRTTVGFILHNLFQMVFGKWRRFGYACVNFSNPVHASEFCREQGINFRKLSKKERFEKVEALCGDLMGSIEEVIPVLPVALLSSIFLRNSENWMSEFDVKGHVHRVIDALRKKGAPVYIPARDGVSMIDTAFDMLKLRRMIVEEKGLFKAAPDSEDILSYYANSISHWQDS
jgi:glycerol-3-phosphate O-acyltransferase